MPSNSEPVRLASTPRPEPTNTLVKPTPTTNQTKATTVAAIKTLPPPAPIPVSNPPAVSQPRLEVVTIPSEPTFKVAQDVAVPAPPPRTETTARPVTNDIAMSRVAPAEAGEKGFLQRINPLNLFHGESKAAVRTTPLPSRNATQQTEDSNETSNAVTSPSDTTSKAEPGGYLYHSIPKAAPGNHDEAQRAFSQGSQAQQSRRLADAVVAYRKATQLDPTYYDAYYNWGLASTEAGNLQSALLAYEHALALRPDSLDARYNFALVLKQANYFRDAANELEKLVGFFPNESRAHVALGNLYAQQLRDPARARQHYLKVLETDPRNPQGDAIRYWIADHPAL